MKQKRLTYMKNIILPCFLLSALTGIITGGLIFLFKIAASWVIGRSEEIYAFVRTYPVYLPLLLVGAVLLGVLTWLILRHAPHCRGGGIPTAVAILRGLIPFHWIKSIFLLFASAMMSFLVGVPLGNEGPSVQMGTAVGRGTVHVAANKHRAWDRYIMTGGACAGFAAATGAPLTGIFFAFEEAHRRFSPMIFMSAATAVVASSTVMNALCGATGINPSLFDIRLEISLSLLHLYAVLVVGLVCGLCAVLFTKLYRAMRALLRKGLARVPFLCQILIIFVAVSLIGVVSAACIGSGHGLIEELLEGHGVWYLLILYACVRAIFLIVANNVGITGGLFVPSLAFGAILGALCARAMIAVGILPEEYYVIMVIVGMASFLGASSRTPITAIMFAAEALCGFSNLLPIALGVTVAFLVIETVGLPAFNDTVIEGKVEAEHAGKTPQIVDAHFTVQPGSFAVGKEIRDILWPPTCVILSVEKSAEGKQNAEPGLSADDILHVHYQTYDPLRTVELLEDLIGEQDGSNARASMHLGNEGHQVPEL